MSGYSGDRVLLGGQRESRISHFRIWVLLLIPLLAILFQVYLPLFFSSLQYVEIPLLVTIYFAMMRRAQVAGLLLGALVGCAQDSLSRDYVGMSGISNTLVGYFAASTALRIDVEHPMIRLLLSFVFLIFERFLHWVMSRALLAQQVPFDIKQVAMIAFLNAVIAVALFHFLDKLKERN